MQLANDEVDGGEGEVIQHKQQTFGHYPRQKINHTWLAFMMCLNEIIEHLGDNDYKTPHMNKEKLK